MLKFSVAITWSLRHRHIIVCDFKEYKWYWNISWLFKTTLTWVCCQRIILKGVKKKNTGRSWKLKKRKLDIVKFKNSFPALSKYYALNLPDDILLFIITSVKNRYCHSHLQKPQPQDWGAQASRFKRAQEQTTFYGPQKHDPLVRVKRLYFTARNDDNIK